MNEFHYLLEKLEKYPMLHEPFAHIEIDNFFSDEHFKQILKSKEVDVSANSDTDLLKKLSSVGWKPIEFPGATTEINKYLKHRLEPLNNSSDMDDPVEGEGVVMRLFEKGEFLSRLDSFFSSEAWLMLVAKRFEIMNKTIYDGGIQKYLDGYEISPHPDIRKKACTWMININPCDDSEKANIHTMYNRFKDEYKYVYDYWDENPGIQRAWVPWDWVEIVKRQVNNNSIVLFSPHSKSLHSVKATYNHNIFQRTQIYGNLWYENDSSRKATWHELEGRKSKLGLVKRGRKFFNKFVSSNSEIGKRNIE